MPDKEKVIERLQKVSNYFKSMLKVGYDGDAEIYREHRESVKMAIALLKEQEEQIDTQRRNLMILLNEPRIVRCKDCEHATITTDGEYCKYCENYTDENGDPIEVYHDADWFCADGERKEGR